MYEIWVVENDGRRVLVRDDVVDSKHADALVKVANHGAELRGEGHRYEAVRVQNSND
ncbi:hypothetical protein PCA31118_05079 [Pandoraea captiosa]|uniref:Uncharacterized protein n=1 Tax=Pandoraea captiosa TaxID=2508302 RepID=A0A5E5ASU2_9BURK|nr:hypothetical protein [Pandoraea captiosa]VVE75862.1 hypothetical protein PCA31118_05079 [Pandoraea captiosa]